MKKIIPFFLLFLFGLVSLGQLQRVELPLGRAIYLHEIVMVALILFSLCFLKIALRSRLLISFLLLNIWILTSIFLAHFTNTLSPLTPVLYLLRFDAYIFFGVALYHLTKQRVISPQTLTWFLYGSITIVALLGWLQYLFIPDTRALVFLGWDDHYLRLISTLFDPGFTGAVLALGSLLLQQKIFASKNDRGIRFALLQWMWLLTTSALLFTYSRASFVAYVAGTLFLLMKERKRAYIVILALFSFAVVCLPRPASEGVRLERTASITARVDTIKSGIDSLSPFQFVTGKGWYSDKQETTRDMRGSLVPDHASAPENSFVFLFTSLGIVGFLLFCWFGWEIIRKVKWNTVAFTAILTMSVHALFSNTLFYPFILFYLGTIISSSTL